MSANQSNSEGMMLLTALAFMTAPIDESALLAEYGSYTHLIQSPNPTYVMKQDSSYDRASKQPGNDAWFANGDAGQYIRTETTEGRTERVMLECDQPGAIMRIWSANPAGTLRFYFDGASTPQWTVPAQDLLSGKVKGMGDPFAYVASRGWNLYYPIPFAKSLKITAEGEGSQHMYYHVGYRKYRIGAALRTFDPNSMAVLAANRVWKALKTAATEKPTKVMNLLGGEAKSIFGSGGSGTVNSITIRVRPKPNDTSGTPWTSSIRLHNILRLMKLDIWTDGEHCVEAPLGDFFGSGVGVNALNSVPMTVTKDGAMTCRFPMPFNRAIDVSVLNGNAFPVDIEFLVKAEKLKSPLARNLFKAHYLAYKGDSQPKRDMEMLHATGEGWLVGSTLLIENSRPDWWGEGDEKIFIDGEAFPSFFGTGTEDFYGYAWCWPEKFNRPFHAQPRCDGPGNFGHTTVNRWMIADAIPFKKSIRFDMELWHWAACDVKFSRVTYWYAKSGGSKIAEFDGSLLLPASLVPNPPVKGAIEGESLKVLSRTGGNLEQQSGFWELSGGKQLWWTHMKDGESLKLEIPTPGPGKYELIGNFCRARDYGIHELSFAGQRPTLDFFNATVGWEKISLGEIETSGTAIELTVTCKGKRADAVAGNMFGVDYFLLVKK